MSEFQLGCPECYAFEFSTSGRVEFTGGFSVEGSHPYFSEDEIIWDMSTIHYVECQNCGWGTEVDGEIEIRTLLVPVFDKSEEDLPNEEQIQQPAFQTKTKQLSFSAW